jgi:hypothetical protein
MSEALGWTEVQQQYSQGNLGGRETLLKVRLALGGGGRGGACALWGAHSTMRQALRSAHHKPFPFHRSTNQLVGIFVVIDLALLAYEYIQAAQSGTPLVL